MFVYNLIYYNLYSFFLKIQGKENNPAMSTIAVMTLFLDILIYALIDLTGVIINLDIHLKIEQIIDQNFLPMLLIFSFVIHYFGYMYKEKFKKKIKFITSSSKEYKIKGYVITTIYIILVGTAFYMSFLKV